MSILDRNRNIDIPYLIPIDAHSIASAAAAVPFEGNPNPVTCGLCLKKIDASNPHSVQCDAMYKHIAHESCLKLEHKSRHSGKLDCIYCQGKCMSCTNNSLNNEIFSACTECLRMTCTNCLKGILIKSIVDYIICVFTMHVFHLLIVFNRFSMHTLFQGT